MAITAHSTHSPERRFIPDRRAANLNKVNNLNNVTAAHPDRLSTIRPGTLPSTNTLSVLGWVAMGLLIVGGINWGLIGFFGFDLVAAIFGPMSVVSRIVYALVGLSAIYTIFSCAKLASRK